ncbi:MAG: type IX secretion system membrane protein PorP/SprF [Prevotellaceae bacterium]|jgi:type IX secretion system PorP/SprF family membrane protein|nr:type IX secretion system membrane protein PorP/SprF [Prevotellaceae bacterium]
MTRCIKLLLLSLLLYATQAAAQQDIQISQYMFNGLALNPALSGGREAPNIQLLYRQQWVGMDGAPQTIMGSMDGTVNKSNSAGLGVQVFNDRIGALNNTGAYLSYAFRFRLNELDDRLNLGLAAGTQVESFAGYDFNATGSDGQPIYDPDEVLGSETTFRPDFRVGVFYSMGQIFYAGVSMTNMGSFLVDTLQNPYVYVNVGGRYWFNEKWSLRPSLLYGQPLKGSGTVDVNLAAGYADRFWFGLSTRVGMPIGAKATGSTQAFSSVSAMAEIWITRVMRLGYCYEYGLNRLAGVQSGTHEVSLGFTLPTKLERYRNPRDF